jgi:chromosome segregation ATPase
MSHSVRGFHILVFSRCVVALLFSTACVSTPQYEQVSSAAEVEREAHRRTHVSLELAQKQLSTLEQRLSRSEGTLNQESDQRAELDLKQTKTEHELGASRDLVFELREEIGRLRNNLDASLSDVAELKTEKSKLERDLELAQKCEPEESVPSTGREDSTTDEGDGVSSRPREADAQGARRSRR